MSKNFKWALVGDLQIPYEDSRAVSLWFKVMKSWKPDAIDIVGDIDDQLEYSKYSDGTTDEFMARLKKEEDPSPLTFVKKNADGARLFYEKVREQHPDANVHVSLGNHDIRIFGYIDRKAPEYAPQITPNTLWGLDDLGMTWRFYHEKPYERFGGMFVHHGVTTSTTGPTVMKEAVEYGASLARGHSHKALIASKHYPLPDRTIHGVETGHMCDPAAYGLQYASNPDWDLGFVLIEITNNGNMQPQFIRIHSDYTCVVNGRVFSS